jgi:hypothetical protein
MKTIILKEKYMLELDFSSREGVEVFSEGVIELAPQMCGILKESNNEESQTQPTRALRDNNKTIYERKKKKKTRRSKSNKKFIVCHCYKNKVHTIDIVGMKIHSHITKIKAIMREPARRSKTGSARMIVFRT